MRLRKYIKRAIIIVALFTLSSFLLATFVLPYALIKPPKRSIDTDFNTVSTRNEAVTVIGFNKDTLSGQLFLPVEKRPKAVILLLHGIGGSKADFLTEAKRLKNDGYACVAMDSRAHGSSGGKYVTYGYHEKKDVAEIIKLLKIKFPKTTIGIWGKSMGGAIALQSMAYDATIDFGIIESTFTNLHQITYDYQKRYSAGIGLRFLTNYTIDRAGEIAQFNPEEVSPIKAVKNIEQPIFMAHGDADARILYAYGQELFENLKSKDKTFTIVKTAGHLNLGLIGGDPYYQSVLTFIERQID